MNLGLGFGADGVLLFVEFVVIFVLYRRHIEMGGRAFGMGNRRKEESGRANNRFALGYISYMALRQKYFPTGE